MTVPIGAQGPQDLEKRTIFERPQGPHFARLGREDTPVEPLTDWVIGVPEAGRTILGRYLVEEKLGQGGMGEVWLVRHLALDARRVIKLIAPTVASDPMARARFLREARVMARLSHPNAVVVHDTGLARDVAYIEMEYVEGKSLDRVLVAGEPRPLAWVANLLEQLCAVLETAHGLGIVHRDLKPPNLMLAPGTDRLKVLDFGIAKILDDSAGPDDLMTGTGVGPCTPAYASPEQLGGGTIDIRSDLYSVGVLLYELLTGRRPFRAPNLIEKQLLAVPRPFAEVHPSSDVPFEVERLVLRCLSKAPDDRPTSASELMVDFRRAMASAREFVGDLATTEGPRARADFRDEPTLEAGSPSVLSPSEARKAPTRTLGRTIAMATAVVTALATGGLIAVAVRATRPSGWPAGYRAEGSTGREFPVALVRESDGARFLRIDGGRGVAGFYLQETEVTNAMLTAYFEATHVRVQDRPVRWRKLVDSMTKEGIEPGPFPAIGVPYEVAEAYARWAGGSLPTGERWEYASKSGGGSNRYVWGDDLPNRTRANVDTAYGVHEFGLAQVKSYPKDRTEQGVHDLAGNVKEWVRDDPQSRGVHALRGGSFLSFADKPEVSATGLATPGDPSLTATDLLEDGSARDLGFRIVLGD